MRCKNEGETPAETLRGFDRWLSKFKNLRGMLSKKQHPENTRVAEDQVVRDMHAVTGVACL